MKEINSSIIKRYRSDIIKVKEEISKVIVGQEKHS